METLKDLTILRKGRARADTDRTNLYDVLQVGEFQEVCYPEQLRQSAMDGIKELKELRQPIPKVEPICLLKSKSNIFKPPKERNTIVLGETVIHCNDKTRLKICDALIALLMYRYNITEDDLK